MNSKMKGAAGERELANKLILHGFNCRRSQQYCGANGDADVVGLPGIHIECKRVEKLNIEKALQQAEADSKGDIPAVFHRRNRETWKVTLRLDDFMKLYKSYKAFDELTNNTDLEYVCSYMVKCGDWCGGKPCDINGDCAEDVKNCYIEYLARVAR